MGEVAAAISVAGHSGRLTEDVMEQIAPDVIAAANAIGDAIGMGKRPDHPKPRRRQ
jgi:DNA-binding IclR family transcriptional regulator